jgi:uncharacterized membrane protein YdbT with pleckstrin-like domain
MSQEQTVLSASSSQVLNFWAFMLLGALLLVGVYLLVAFGVLALAWLVAVALAALWKYLDVNCQRYELTTERLKTQSGVFTKVTHELELYRVKDIMFEQPFFLRLFGLGHVILMTSDMSTPTLTLKAIPDAENWREKLRYCTETRRAQKRTQVTEVE